MKDRGENSYIKLPIFAARTYDKMMQLEPLKAQRAQIAQELLNNINEGKFLDIETGHGRILLEINNRNPNIEQKEETLKFLDRLTCNSINF